jgi:hypothetical protein
MTDVTTATAGTTTAPAAPAPPATPSEAASRLAGLREDKSWADKLLLGKDAATLAEFHSLSKLIASGDDIDLAMSGDPNLPDSGVDGKLSLAKVASAIPDLRDSGLSDGVIKELLGGRQSTPEELTAVKRLQTMRHSDPNWVKAYLSGRFEQVRESRLISAVLLAAPP